MDARKAQSADGDRMHRSAGVAQSVERQPSKITEGRSGSSAGGAKTGIVERKTPHRANRSELSETAANGAGVARNVANVARSYSGRELDAIASPAFVERFLGKIGEPDANGCRFWLGTIWSSAHVGYGCIKYGRGSSLGAHRVMYALTHRWLPPVVMHSCDRRDCVEPSHLLPGTHALNAADRVAKGRDAHGARNGAAKLTAEKVLNARERRAAGESAESIAREFGVSARTIRDAVRGTYWRSVAA